MAKNQGGQGGEQVMIGVSFTGLVKCEDENCGLLFIKETSYLFQIPGAEPKDQPPQTVKITCPEKHTKVKFIQSIEKTPITVMEEDGAHGER